MSSFNDNLEYRLIQLPNEKDFNKIPLDLLIQQSWISEKNCKYPQELIIALRKESNVEKVEILSHNSFIAHKIDLFAGIDYGTKKEHWKELGTVTLKEVKSSDTKHELKRVYLDEICNAFKLKLHQNYEHKTANPHNQVGLVQIRLFGRNLAMAQESIAFKYVEQGSKGISNKVRKERNVDRTYTEELDGILESIEKSKERGIEASDFQLAKAAQLSIRTLTKSRKEMEELENDQTEAVKNDDFERANDIRQEMKTFRANILSSIDPNLIEDLPPNDPLHNSTTRIDNLGIYRPKELFDNEIKVYPPPQPKLFEPIKLSPRDKYESIDMNFLIPPRPSSKNRNTSAESIRSSTSTQTLSPLPRIGRSVDTRSPSPIMIQPKYSSTVTKKLPSPKQRVESPIISPGEKTLKSILRRPSSIERTSSKDNYRISRRTPSPTPTVSSYASSTSIRPSDKQNNKKKHLASAHRSHSFSSSSSSSSSNRPSGRSRNLFLEKENMIVPAVLRSRRASDSELSVHNSEERTPSRRIEDIYHLLHPQQKIAMGDGVRVFGEDTMTNVYAKEWETRREGLRVIQSHLKRINGDKRSSNDAMRATINIISKSLRDKLYNVYIQSLSLLEYVTIEFIPNNVLHGHMKELADSIHETLVNKAGDTTNDRRCSSETMKSVKKIIDSDKKVAKILISKFITAKEREGTRAEKGRAKIIHQAVMDHNAPNNELSLTSVNVGRFGVACMKSTDSEVRSLGRDLFMKVYGDTNEQSRLRKLLPDPSSHQAQSSIFKQLFAEMEGRLSTAASMPIRRRTNSKSAKSVRITEDAKDNDPSDIDYDKMCMFCGITDDSFTPSQLDRHYLIECPMLTPCQHCNEVIEVSDMRKHLMEECRAKGLYKLCPTCREPIERKDYHRHVGKKNCHPSPPNCIRCLLCDDEVSPSNDVGWRKHLLNECTKGRGRGKKRGKKNDRTYDNNHLLFIPRS